jgi:hypothetical protein
MNSRLGRQQWRVRKALVTGRWAKPIARPFRGSAGQTAFEFLMTLILVGIIFAVFSLLIIFNLAILTPDNPRAEKTRAVADELAQRINYAYVQGDGYQNSFRMPEQIGGRDYVILASTNKSIEVDVIEQEGELDAFGVANINAPSVRLYGFAATTVITNSNGTVTVRPAP